MPWQTVTLRPGINVEATPTLNQAGFSTSAFVRWRDAMVEKIGGWSKFYAFVLSGTPRALHAWQDLSQVDRLAVGTTTQLGVITSGILTDLTPQSLTSSFNPNFATTASSTTVTIDDPNISNVTTFDTINFMTPVSIGGVVLSGAYPIDLILGATSYQITAATAATTTRANLGISAITQANPGVVTYTGADNIANTDLTYFFGISGMTQANGITHTVAGLNTAANTFTIEDTSGYTAYTSGGSISFGMVPRFTTTSGSSSVSVQFQDHGLVAGNTFNFPLATTVGGLTIQDTYEVLSVTNADNFVISADSEATSSTSAFMNAGQAEIVYSIALGPPAGSTGYGIGTYGSGGYGTGSTSSAQTGTPITATNWSLDNWGEILLANPEGGAIYYWQPKTGFQTARSVIPGPAYNNGIFVAMPAQILVAIGSTISQTVGIEQDPLLVRWSDQEDFFTWTVTATTQAGSFHIPTGSKLVGGLQTRNFACLWTDIDLWSMEYIGPPLVFSFNKLAGNCGLIGKHAVAQMANNVYWMGQKNFFSMTGNGISPIPCSVWDACFQDLDTTHQHLSIAATNTPFNEVLFFFPSVSVGSGDPDKYVKFNTLSPAWDYGTLSRTAWIDTSVLGNPIGASSAGVIYTQESGYDADGSPINASFTTGYWVLSEGEEFAFVDWFVPDFKYGTFSGTQGANLQITLYATDYPGQTPRTYGPYTVTSSTEAITTRLRGRQMAMKVESNDVGSFWRLGAMRLRYAISGRR
ncbi:MAG TPA: ubiquitin-activating E1 FCCH domain-containing protein [Pseudolabrys sp.]